MHVTNENPGGSMGAMTIWTVLRALWRSTVGKKALVAASGLALCLWVILHVAGNHPLRTHARAADVARGCVRPRGVQREQWHRGSDALTT